MEPLFEKICRQLELGAPLSPPVPITGGLLHRMFALHTAKGRFALKLLNPSIMARETAMENYAVAEELERRLEEKSIPILGAITFGGQKMQKTDGQFFYLFPWYEGRAMQPDEITESHCQTVGALLAALHAAGYEDGTGRFDSCENRFNDSVLRDDEQASSAQYPDAENRSNDPQEKSGNSFCYSLKAQKPEEPPAQGISIPWDTYIERMEAHHGELSQLLARNRALLYESQAKGNQAMGKISSLRTICHNDLDYKNILWNNGSCRIIDLECLSWGNPFFELYETALYWSGYERDCIDPHLMERFLHAYRQAGGLLPEDWAAYYDGCYGRLEWLAYNMDRVLDENTDSAERSIGLQEIPKTIAHIVCYRQSRDTILRCLEPFTYRPGPTRYR